MAEPAWFHWEGDTLVVRLHIQPRASRSEVVGPHGGSLKVRIAAPPVEGAANQALIRFLAQSFGVPAHRVEIRSGTGGRSKRAAIHAPRQLPDWLEHDATK